MSQYHDTVSRAVAMLASESTAPEAFNSLTPTWAYWGTLALASLFAVIAAVSLASGRTAERLSKQLVKTPKVLAMLAEDERLAQVRRTSRRWYAWSVSSSAATILLSAVAWALS